MTACAVVECNRTTGGRKSGLCQRHDFNIRTYGSHEVKCSAEGCELESLAKGLCQSHYDRLRRYGNTGTRPSNLTCVDCGVLFPVRATGNLPKRCDNCRDIFHAEQVRKDRWRKGLWEGYRITPAQYQAMFAAQGGKCAICGTHEPSGRGSANGRFSVDHDHATGAVRGLLCTHCNTGLGLFRDDPNLLMKAINYLE